MSAELLHISSGLAGALALTSLSAWAYPQGRAVIWTCGAAAMVVVVLMGIGPLRRARRADRG